MVVQHNLTAMNSNRQLGITTGSQAKSAEKLSSGYRINRAGDDAAGLKISEKMRSQIRGLNKASTNAQDGVSLIQTAEGALNEAHSILQRMNELAVQGANDTNENIDREAINEELTALTTELDRIADTTQFNKQNLLDGSFVSKNLHVGANTDQKIAISIDSMNAAAIGLKDVVDIEETTYEYVVTSGTAKTTCKTMASAEAKISAKASTATATSVATFASIGTNAGIYKLTNANMDAPEFYVAGDLTAYASLDEAKAAYKEALMHENLTVTTATASAKVKALTVSTYAKAQATLSKIQNAINEVSSQRSALGAIQNRLEHTIANLDNVSENTQAAESRIRDTDMASEMVEYSKNNILAQAGQSMLAQANQANQGVLSLLQ